MKKKEWIIIVLIIAVSFGMIIWQRSSHSKTVPDGDAKGMWVAVVHRNEIILCFDSGEDQICTVEGDVSTMDIEVKDGRWHVKEVGCYDHTCQKMGWRDANDPASIICMPNDIVIVDLQTAQNMTGQGK